MPTVTAHARTLPALRLPEVRIPQVLGRYTLTVDGKPVATFPSFDDAQDYISTHAGAIGGTGMAIMATAEALALFGPEVVAFLPLLQASNMGLVALGHYLDKQRASGKLQ